MEHETAETERDPAEIAPEVGGGATVELADELLIEEISIDGMCGVY